MEGADKTAGIVDDEDSSRVHIGSLGRQAGAPVSLSRPDA